MAQHDTRPAKTTVCTVTGPIVVDTFTAATAIYGAPFSMLTDDGLVFATRFAPGGDTSRNGFETLLAPLGVEQKNSKPNHPTTCGKVCED